MSHCRNYISLCLDSMIKPVVIMSQPDENSDDQLMLVVEVGKVKLALPPRLSKVVQLFKEVILISIFPTTLIE